MSQETLIDRMIFAADRLDQPPPPSNPPPGTSLPKMLRDAAVEIADWQASSESYRLDAEKLRAFTRWAIEEGSFAGCDLDGGSIQDKAVELGILVRTKYDPAVHGESDSAERGDDWFVFASALEQNSPT